MAGSGPRPPVKAYVGESPYIFVSYAHVDARTVYAEIRFLNSKQYRIWYDEGVSPGNEWSDEIARAIDHSQIVLVFISASACASNNVRSEIYRALDQDKPFLAIHTEETKLPPGLAMRMSGLQALQRYKMGKERYRAQLLKALPSSVVGDDPVSHPPTTPLSVRQSAGHRRALIITLAMALIAGAGVLGYRLLLTGGELSPVSAVTATIVLASASGVAVDGPAHSAYITGLGSLWVIDTRSNNVSERIPVGSVPDGVAVGGSPAMVYVANWGDGTVSVIDTRTHKVTETIAVGKKPAGVAVDGPSASVYVTNYADGTVSVIDTQTNQITDTVKVGGRPGSVAVDSARHCVYVTNLENVSVIDSQSRAVVDTIEVGSVPISVAIDESSDTAYVVNYGGESVSFVDTRTNMVTAVIPVGREPDGVAVDGLAHAVYVANSDSKDHLGDDTVSVIDTRSKTMLKAITVRNLPNELAVDVMTGTLYVLHGAGGGVSVLAR